MLTSINAINLKKKNNGYWASNYWLFKEWTLQNFSDESSSKCLPHAWKDSIKISISDILRKKKATLQAFQKDVKWALDSLEAQPGENSDYAN